MYFYDNLKKIKSIDDLSIGDLFLFSHERFVGGHIIRYKINSKWVVISKVDNKRISIRSLRSKQIITLSSHKLMNGSTDVELKDRKVVTFDLFYRKRYSGLEFLKLNLKRLKKWVSLK